MGKVSERVKTMFAQKDKRIKELREELFNKTADLETAEKQLESVQHKADAYDAMCEVGLIQFDPNIKNHVYSVWGFTCWHHDEDILKAIAAANEPAKTIAALQEDES